MSFGMAGKVSHTDPERDPANDRFPVSPAYAINPLRLRHILLLLGLWGISGP